MKIIPIYNSRGELGAYLRFPNVYNVLGEWVGFCTADREVYSVLGHYVGFLSEDHRILRPRTLAEPRQQREAPGQAARLIPPAAVPLAPMMRELTHSTVDVLIEQPERLHTVDMGELRPDLE